MRNSTNAHRYPPMAVHAPIAPHGMTLPEETRWPYCVEFGDDTVKVAKRGQKVTCKLCLRKLKKKAQYANFLTAAGIFCGGL